MNERENFSGQRPQTFSCFVPYIYNLLKNSKPDDPTDMLSGKIVDDPRGGSAITRRVRPGVTRATARRPSSRRTARRSPARRNGRAAACRAAPAWRSGRRGYLVRVGVGVGVGVRVGVRVGIGVGVGVSSYLGHRVRRGTGGDELGHITASIDRSRHRGHLRKV